MAWAKAGTVTVYFGGTTVEGLGTQFTKSCRVGDGFAGPDDRLYEIVNIVSDVQLTLGTPYAGVTAGAKPYRTLPIQGYPQALADQARTLLNSAGGVIDSDSITALSNTVAGGPNLLPYFTGPSTMDLVTFPPFARTAMAASTDAAAARQAIGAAGTPSTVIIASSTDFNAVVAGGFHPALLGPGNANKPPTGVSDYWYVWVFNYADSVTQVAYPYGVDTSSVIYYRSKYQGAWTAWRYTVSNAHFTTWSLGFVAAATSQATARTTLGLVPVTSVVDSTSTRLMTPGSHGIGGQSVNASSNGVSFTGAKNGGLYGYYQAAGAPSASLNVLEAPWGIGTDWISQLAMGVSTNTLWYRSFRPGVLTPEFARMFSTTNAFQPVSSDLSTTGLMEVGVNSNGIYWKYANGQLVCTVVFVGYTINVAKSMPWPHQFVGVVNVLENSIPTNGWDFGCTAYGNTGEAIFYSWSMTSAGNTVVMTGIGNWR